MRSDSGKKKFSGRPPDAERNYHGCGIPATVRGIGLIRKSEDKKTPPPQIANPIERLTEQMYVERMKYYASPKQRSVPVLGGSTGTALQWRQLCRTLTGRWRLLRRSWLVRRRRQCCISSEFTARPERERRASADSTRIVIIGNPIGDR